MSYELRWTSTEPGEPAVVVAWHRDVGDEVVTGDAIVSLLDGDGTTHRVEATSTGLLAHVLVDAGIVIASPAVLGIVSEPVTPSTGGCHHLRKRPARRRRPA